MQRPTAKHDGERQSRLEGSLSPFPQSSCRRRGGGILGARGVEDTQKAWPVESLTRAHRVLQRLNWQLWSLCGSVLGHLQISYGYWLGVFVGLLTVGVGVSLTLFALGILGLPHKSFDVGVYI